MFFASDNGAGASKGVMDTLVAANHGFRNGYGNDDETREIEALISALFETDCSVYLVSTGTAANSLALSALCPPYGQVLAHEFSHIVEDECGAPEFFMGGARLLKIAGKGGKISLADLKNTLEVTSQRNPHAMPMAALSLSNVTESGGVYSLSELATLNKTAKAAGLKTHMDGARFANAMVALNCSPAELSWKAGVDCLTFGATKNGALALEAVIFFDKTLAHDFHFKRKRGGHLVSKHRLLTAQMKGYLANNHWLENAKHANSMASLMEQGLKAKGVRLAYPVEANELFPIFSDGQAAKLQAAGGIFYPWGARDLINIPHKNEAVYRLVTSFATTTEMVESFLKALD